MIGQLKGLVEAVGSDSVLIDVQGVGYVVFCSGPTLATLSAGSNCALKILTHVREDHIHLYGFSDSEERSWFDLLVGVQGVGPKMGLAILSILRPQDLANALALEDKRPFQSVSGVGPKLASRLVSELKEKSPKVDELATGSTGSAQPTKTNLSGKAAILSDLVSALTNLGYDEASARQAAHTAVQDGGEDGDLVALVPLALKFLAS